MKTVAQSSREREERRDCEFCIEDLQALLAAQRLISSSLDPNVVARITADEARRITSTEMAAVYLLAKNRLEVAAISGSLHKSLLGHVVNIEGSLAGKVLRTGRPFLLEDTHCPANGYSPVLERFMARSITVVPLTGHGEAIGAILVANRTPGGLGPEGQCLLELLAEGAAVALENARCFTQSQQETALRERRRLARRLQGAVAQMLFSVSLIADILPRLWDRDPQEGRRRLEELRQITRGLLVEFRNLSQDE